MKKEDIKLENEKKAKDLEQFKYDQKDKREIDGCSTENEYMGSKIKDTKINDEKEVRKQKENEKAAGIKEDMPHIMPRVEKEETPTKKEQKKNEKEEGLPSDMPNIMPKGGAEKESKNS